MSDKQCLSEHSKFISQKNASNALSTCVLSVDNSCLGKNSFHHFLGESSFTHGFYTVLLVLSLSVTVIPKQSKTNIKFYPP